MIRSAYVATLRREARAARRPSVGRRAGAAALEIAIATALYGGAGAARSANAAAAPSAESQTGAPSDSLAEIVVTARKRSEDLQKVPESIDVFDAKSLQRLGITQFEDYATKAPSVSYISIGPGYQQFFMRGVSDGSSPNNQNTSTTGYYLDEQSLSYYGGIPDLHAYDIARIEVLNGPQGTLFGASSMSGAIRVITNKPDPHRFSGGMDLDGGQIDGGGLNDSVEGYVNLPFGGGRSALRMSGYLVKKGGFIDNLLETRQWVNGTTSTNAEWAGNNYNHEQYAGGRVAWLQEFGDRWKATLSANFQHQKVHGAWDQNPSVNGDRNVARFGPESQDRYNRIMSLTVDGDLGIADLVYAGGYFSRSNHQVNEYSEYAQYVNTPSVTADKVQAFACQSYDPTTTPPTFSGCNVPTLYYDYHEQTFRWSHEVRLQSKPGGTTHWTAGLYYEQTKDRYSYFYTMPGINFQGSQAASYISYYGGNPLPEEWYSSDSRQDNHQVAAFGELTQDLTSRWSLTFGLRDFRSRFSAGSLWGGYFYQPKVPSGVANGSSSKIDYKAGVNFQATPTSLYYFSYAQGFRDGGFNTEANCYPKGVPASFSPDTLDSYELGWKLLFKDGRYRWNGAVYYMPWKGYQAAVYDLSICPNTFNANIGDARVYGAETNFDARPVEGLTLSVSLAYNDSRLTRTTYTDANFPVVGNERLPFIPYVKASASARYERPVLRDWVGYLQYDVSHTGSMWSDLRFDNRSLQPQFNIANLRTGVHTADDVWSVEAYVTNLDNTRAVVYVNTYNYDHRQTTNEPRVFGLHIRYRFGGG
ncbi:MAG: TonB-dependent receptor [Gammaproteobacteria bacterium]|nr:TonB-dependent receptor [Gammaproteobacteria bacterium]